MPCSVHAVLKAISQGHGTAWQGRGMGTAWHIGFMKCSEQEKRAREEEGELHNLFERLKGDRQKSFKYFRMSFQNLKNLTFFALRH
jgi:hypothetical protein